MQADFIALSNSTYALCGDLNFNTVEIINTKASKLLSFKQDIAVDFQKVKQCDSAGIALILHWKKLAIRCKIHIKFINITLQMQNMMKLMGLTQIINELETI